jgi:hypothetical protein
MMSFWVRSGIVVTKKRIVSLSMIQTSRKFAVIEMMSYLSRDSRIRTTIITSDSAADTAGRRSKVSQKKLSRPQNRRKTAFRTIEASLQAMSASAARWNVAISPMRHASRRKHASVATQRLVSDEMESAMAGTPVPGHDHLYARRTGSCNRSAFVISSLGYLIVSVYWSAEHWPSRVRRGLNGGSSSTSSTHGVNDPIPGFGRPLREF